MTKNPEDRDLAAPETIEKQTPPAYEPTQLISFEPLADASGDCTNCTSDAVLCATGTNGVIGGKGCAGRSYARRA